MLIEDVDMQHEESEDESIQVWHSDIMCIEKTTILL